MVAYTPNPGRRGRRRSFLPRGRFELIVDNAEYHTLHLVAYQQGDGEFYVELHHGDTKLRSLHTHDSHRNPDPERTVVPGPHVHFPSRRFPLLYGREEYAYPLDTPRFSDSIDSILFFCAHVGIDIDSMQLQLAFGGGR